MSPKARLKSRAVARKTSQKKPRHALTAEDLYDFQTVSEAAISPDEKRIAYTVESVNAEHKRYFSCIHIHDTESKSCRQYTFGEVSDRNLAWSPDGQTLAFVSTRDKKNAIYLISADGGSERKLLELDGSFGPLQWFPNGKRLLFSFTKNDSFDEKDDKKKKEEPLFRHVTRFFYRLDGAGYLPNSPTGVWTVDSADGAAKQISRGKLNHEAVTLSPDGKKVYFIACDKKDIDRYSAYSDIFVFPSSGGKTKKLKSPIGPKMALALSPDGKTLAFLGHDDIDDGWGVTNTHVWLMPSSGSTSAKNIIAKFDRHATDQTIGDICDASFSGALKFSLDGKRVYFVASDTGNTHLFYATRSGGMPTRVTKRPMHVKAFSLNGKCRTAALVMSNLKQTPELYTVPAQYHGDEEMQQCTSVNGAAMSKINFGKTTEKWFTGFDGTRLQGWLTLPPNFNPNKRYPAILEVHGGPRGQYGNTFFHEMNYLAAKGYVVFYTNPRGGNGRGETFAAAICGGWGDLDYRDVMSATDYLSDLPYVNQNKLGITGGSYGGYMTNWVIGHTTRFKAAVTQRSVVDLFSFVGSSDIGFELYREFDGQPWENPENYRKCSPITYLGKNVRTPVLIIHSEKDLRCHIGQAEQMFVKLKLLGKTVEMVRFPEEPHGLSRHGRPDRRVARLHWISKWFDKYLK